MGFLDKIKKENARLEKQSPYNFCDRWCERCPLNKKETCKVYQEDFNFTLQCIAAGKDPEDPDLMLETERKNLQKTIKLLAEIAKKENIDLEAAKKNASGKKKEQEKFLRSNPLQKKGLLFSQKTKDFICSNLPQPEEEMPAPELIEAFETLNWYHALLPVKIQRILCDLYFNKFPDQFKETVEDEFSFFDAVAQIEICNKCIAQSQTALSKIFTYNIESRYSISELLEILRSIQKDLSIILSEIDGIKK